MGIRAVGADDDALIDRLRTARTERQKILTRQKNPCELHAVFEEGALLRITDAEVRAEQRRWLLTMSKRPNVTTR